MELCCFMILVHANKDAQIANRDLMLHTKELEVIMVLPALQGQQVLSYLHKCVFSEQASSDAVGHEPDIERHHRSDKS